MSADSTSLGSGSDIAQQVLDLVRASSPGAEAEVVVSTSDLALTRFANSFIHQNMADSTTTVRLRLYVDGRTASGSTSLGAAATVGSAPGALAALRGLVERTVTIAGLSPTDPRWPGLAPPQPTQPAAPVDELTAYSEPAARADRVRAFVAAAGGLETAGYCSTLRLATTFANSAGQLAHAVTAEAGLDAIARNQGADGVARFVAARLDELDGAILGARAAAKARAGVDPIELPPGRYEVVLEPTAVLDLMQLLAFAGFNAKAVAEQRSFVELGAAQFDPAITLVDEPYGAGAPFDVEGTPRSRLTLVDAGTVTSLVHDRRTAAAAGTSSTGHATPGGAAWGALATNLYLLANPGDGAGASAEAPAAATEVAGPAADSAVAALVAGVGRGLLVTDNWYTRMLDPRSLIVTGLTRNGVWLIEDGVVTRPVRNMRFTQSYPQALAPGAVLGVGTHSVALPSGWDVMTYRAPALRLASWNYTGNASG